MESSSEDNDSRSSDFIEHLPTLPSCIVRVRKLDKSEVLRHINLGRCNEANLEYMYEDRTKSARPNLPSVIESDSEDDIPLCILGRSSRLSSIADIEPLGKTISKGKEKQSIRKCGRPRKKPIVDDVIVDDDHNDEDHNDDDQKRSLRKRNTSVIYNEYLLRNMSVTNTSEEHSPNKRCRPVERELPNFRERFSWSPDSLSAELDEFEKSSHTLPSNSLVNFNSNTSNISSNNNNDNNRQLNKLPLHADPNTSNISSNNNDNNRKLNKLPLHIDPNDIIKKMLPFRMFDNERVYVTAPRDPCKPLVTSLIPYIAPHGRSTTAVKMNIPFSSKKTTDKSGMLIHVDLDIPDWKAHNNNNESSYTEIWGETPSPDAVIDQYQYSAEFGESSNAVENLLAIENGDERKLLSVTINNLKNKPKKPPRKAKVIKALPQKPRGRRKTKKDITISLQQEPTSSQAILPNEETNDQSDLAQFVTNFLRDTEELPTLPEPEPTPAITALDTNVIVVDKSQPIQAACLVNGVWQVFPGYVVNNNSIAMNDQILSQHHQVVSTQPQLINLNYNIDTSNSIVNNSEIVYSFSLNEPVQSTLPIACDSDQPLDLSTKRREPIVESENDKVLRQFLESQDDFSDTNNHFDVDQMLSTMAEAVSPTKEPKRISLDEYKQRHCNTTTTQEITDFIENNAETLSQNLYRDMPDLECDEIMDLVSCNIPDDRPIVEMSPPTTNQYSEPIDDEHVDLLQHRLAIESTDKQIPEWDCNDFMSMVDCNTSSEINETNEITKNIPSNNNIEFAEYQEENTYKAYAPIESKVDSNDDTSNEIDDDVISLCASDFGDLPDNSFLDDFDSTFVQDQPKHKSSSQPEHVQQNPNSDLKLTPIKIKFNTSTEEKSASTDSKPIPTTPIKILFNTTLPNLPINNTPPQENAKSPIKVIFTNPSSHPDQTKLTPIKMNKSDLEAIKITVNVENDQHCRETIMDHPQQQPPPVIKPIVTTDGTKPFKIPKKQSTSPTPSPSSQLKTIQFQSTADLVQPLKMLQACPISRRSMSMYLDTGSSSPLSILDTMNSGSDMSRFRRNSVSITNDPIPTMVEKIYGQLCSTLLYGENCLDKFCSSPHKFLDADNMKKRLVELNESTLTKAFGIAMRHEPIYSLYFSLFCEIYAERNDPNKLLSMISSCELYKEKCGYIWSIYNSLVKCGWNKVNTINRILGKIPTNSVLLRYGRAIDAFMEMFIDADVTKFSNIILQFTKLSDYRFEMRWINHMAGVCNEIGNKEFSTTTMFCLNRVDPVKVSEAKSIDLIEFLRRVQNNEFV